MNEHRTRDLDDFEFADERSWLPRITVSWADKILSISRLTHISPPVFYRSKGKKDWFRSRFVMPDLLILGKIAGFDDSINQEKLSFHQRRLRSYQVASIVGAVLFSSTGPLLFVAVAALFGFVIEPAMRMLDLYVLVGKTDMLFYIVLFLLLFLAIFLIVRLLSYFFGRQYAETLCVVSCIHLVIEMRRPDAFFPPYRKKRILARINDLARNTIILSFIYASSNNENQAWLYQHFKNLESNIREKERWAIAPRNTTQSDLQRYFQKMGLMYIHGSYGDYQWDGEFPSLMEMSKEPTFIQNIFRGIAFALPFILLFILFYYPEIPGILGLDSTPITLLVIAWSLLVIDAGLGLGIVERITGVAKAIKELK